MLAVAVVQLWMQGYRNENKDLLFIQEVDYSVREDLTKFEPVKGKGTVAATKIQYKLSWPQEVEE